LLGFESTELFPTHSGALIIVRLVADNV
jgi:hypothetical protein